jgi:sulfur-carrier protein
MPILRFTATLARHRETPVIEALGATVAEVIATGLAEDPFLKAYLLDEQGRLRKHVNIFVDGRKVTDRLRLSDPVGPRSEVYILQALSGG